MMSLREFQEYRRYRSGLDEFHFATPGGVRLNGPQIPLEVADLEWHGPRSLHALRRSASAALLCKAARDSNASAAKDKTVPVPRCLTWTLYRARHVASLLP